MKALQAFLAKKRILAFFPSNIENSLIGSSTVVQREVTLKRVFFRVFVNIFLSVRRMDLILLLA